MKPYNPPGTNAAGSSSVTSVETDMLDQADNTQGYIRIGNSSAPHEGINTCHAPAHGSTFSLTPTGSISL